MTDSLRRTLLVILSVATISAAAVLLLLPAREDMDCSDFGSQAEAQSVFNRSRVDQYHLDRDGDGVACESLERTP